MDDIGFVHSFYSFQNLVGDGFYCCFWDGVVIIIDPLCEIILAFLHDYVGSEIFVEDVINGDYIFVLREYF